MVFSQHAITLDPKPEGMHLIGDEIIRKVPEIKNIKVGLAHVFIKHSSAGLTLNENADPAVRTDAMYFLNKMFPPDVHFEHVEEGPVDMPSHLKAMFVGTSVSVPITNGRFNVGTWQDIYLAEFREGTQSRKVVVTVQGE